MSNEILYLLRVAKGLTREPDVVLRRGDVRPVFAAGTAGTWLVHGEGVAPAHVLFAFNGDELYVAAAPGATATVDGARLDARWERVTRTAQVAFGSARIAVLPRRLVTRARERLPSTPPEQRADEEASTADADAALVEALRRRSTHGEGEVSARS